MKLFIIKYGTLSDVELLLDRLKIFGGTLKQIQQNGEGTYFISYRANNALIKGT
jgi:hypothetical protein